MAIKAPLDLELRLMDELAVKYLKTYQVWHHRRLLLTEMRKPAPELDFIARSLKEDEKNYHTWSYRQWLLAYFNDDALWEGEITFVEHMLQEDTRNNSAWHHRFFTVFQSGIRKGDEDREAVLRRELVSVSTMHGHLGMLTNYHLDSSKRRYRQRQTTLPRGITFVVFWTTLKHHTRRCSCLCNHTPLPANPGKMWRRSSTSRTLCHRRRPNYRARQRLSSWLTYTR